MCFIIGYFICNTFSPVLNYTLGPLLWFLFEQIRANIDMFSRSIAVFFINEINFSALILTSIQSIGTNSSIAWIYGLMSKESHGYLAYAAYRTDVLLRETALLGAVGGVGLGWQLQESLGSFAWALPVVWDLRLGEPALKFAQGTRRLVTGAPRMPVYAISRVRTLLGGA